MASVLDSLGVVAFNALVGPHADPRRLKKLKPPERLPRPGHRPRRKASSSDLKRMFGGSVAYRPREV